jgi:hypothetical protein
MCKINLLLCLLLRPGAEAAEGQGEEQQVNSCSCVAGWCCSYPHASNSSTASSRQAGSALVPMQQLLHHPTEHGVTCSDYALLPAKQQLLLGLGSSWELSCQPCVV